MDQQTLPWDQAREGMDRALKHAEDEVPGWGEVALLYLKRYAREHRQFTALEVRQSAKEWGLVEPPTPKAFGSVFQKAARLGVIRKIGYAPHAERHASPTVLWASCST